MQNGSKYIPPHLRNSGSRGSSQNNYNDNGYVGGGGGGGGGGRGGKSSSRAGYGSHRAGYGSGNRNNSYNRRGGGGGGGGGHYNNNNNPPPPHTDDFHNNQPPQPPPTNSRWSNVDTRDIDNGYDNTRRYTDRNTGYRSNYNTPRRNERNLHGDMRPDKRMERELFEKDVQQTTGINFDNYDNIPVETSGQDIPDPISIYSEETVGVDLFRNVQLCGYSKPTPVQKYSVPIGTAGRDLMACAQTGSGKTAGFLFPIIMSMIRHGGTDAPEGSRRRVYPEGLVLAPTRELAVQIHDEAKKFTYCTGIASVVIYGGADVREQLKRIERGSDLLVATPGRLVDLIERGRIGLDNIRLLVLDEADRMLDMGFEPQIRRIVEQEGMPNPEYRQTMMFSATFPANIQRLASDFLQNYIFLTVGRVGSASKDVVQSVEYVENNDKMEHLMRFLLTIEEGLILIFVETKRSCDYVEDVLCAKGFPACSIHGDKSQREREEALRSFKNARTPVMVATDVASRGLDIPNVTQVLNFDLPTNIDDYVHRIGRTGRAGNTGAALSFVNERNTGIIRELYELLEENDQVCPPWLKSMVAYQSGGRSGRRGGRNNNNFGGRDYRTHDNGNRRNQRDDNNHRSYGGGGGGGGHQQHNHYGGGYSGGGNMYGGGGGNFNNSAW